MRQTLFSVCINYLNRFALAPCSSVWPLLGISVSSGELIVKIQPGALRFRGSSWHCSTENTCLIYLKKGSSSRADQIESDRKPNTGWAGRMSSTFKIKGEAPSRSTRIVEIPEWYRLFLNRHMYLWYYLLSSSSIFVRDLASKERRERKESEGSTDREKKVKIVKQWLLITIKTVGKTQIHLIWGYWLH